MQTPRTGPRVHRARSPVRATRPTLDAGPAARARSGDVDRDRDGHTDRNVFDDGAYQRALSAALFFERLFERNRPWFRQDWLVAAILDLATGHRGATFAVGPWKTGFEKTETDRTDFPLGLCAGSSSSSSGRSGGKNERPVAPRG